MLVEIVFAVLAIVVLASAIMVLRVRELVHAAIWLAAMMLGVAGLFLTVGAEFLATVQILVYVGAVITLILFTVMLTVPVPLEQPDWLASLRLPVGVTVERIEDIHRATPAYAGAGPYKDLQETNPRKPLREPENLYGVSLTDNEYGTEHTRRKKEGGQ